MGGREGGWRGVLFHVIGVGLGEVDGEKDLNSRF